MNGSLGAAAVCVRRQLDSAQAGADNRRTGTDGILLAYLGRKGGPRGPEGPTWHGGFVGGSSGVAVAATVPVRCLANGGAGAGAGNRCGAPHSTTQMERRLSALWSVL